MRSNAVSICTPLYAVRPAPGCRDRLTQPILTARADRDPLSGGVGVREGSGEPEILQRKGGAVGQPRLCEALLRPGGPVRNGGDRYHLRAEVTCRLRGG